MRGVIFAAHVFRREVGVDLRGCDVFVAEKFLDVA